MNTKLLYCNYPVLEHDREPEWVGMLDRAATAGKLNCSLYRPFVPAGEQVHLQEFLEKEGSSRLATVAALLNINMGDKIGYDILLRIEQNIQYSSNVIIKDLTVLSVCDLVVTDCDTPDYGTRDNIHILAKMVGIPTINVNNKFIEGPWLHALGDYRSKTDHLINLVNALLPKEKVQNDTEA